MVENDFTGDLKLAELYLKETPTQEFKYRRGEYNSHANLDQIENDNTRDMVNHNMIQMDSAKRNTLSKTT